MFKHYLELNTAGIKNSISIYFTKLTMSKNTNRIQNNFSLQDLSSWFTHLKELHHLESESRSRYTSNIEKLKIIHDSANYYNTTDKIKAFSDKRDILIKEMEESEFKNRKAKLDILEHCMILPKGPFFRIDHALGTFRISRDTAFVQIFIRSGMGRFDFLEKIRYRFLEVLPGWETDPGRDLR